MEAAVDPAEDADKRQFLLKDMFTSVAYFSLLASCGEREKFVSGKNMLIYVNKRFSSLRIRSFS